MIAVLVVALLTYAAMRNDRNQYRAAAIVCVLWITTASSFVYYFGPYDEAVSLVGYYQYQAIYPLLQILCLSLIRGKLAACLMILFCVEIIFNCFAFWIEGQNLYTDTLYQSTIWAVFVVQMALMLSRTLTNGVHHQLCRFNMARNPAKAISASINGSDSGKGDTGEAQA